MLSALWEKRVTHLGAPCSSVALLLFLALQVRRTEAAIRRERGADGRICRRSNFAELVVGCDSDPLSGLLSTAGDLAGIGTDPVFNRHSVLYNDGLDPAAFYNASQAGLRAPLAGCMPSAPPRPPPLCSIVVPPLLSCMAR